MDLHATLLSHQLAAEAHMKVITGNYALNNVPGAQEHKTIFSAYMDKQNNVMPQVKGIARNLMNGEVVPTGNRLDVAIIGEGYFKILTPEGTRYTRNGRFRLSDAGEFILGKNGRVLMEDGSPLTLPAGAGLDDVFISNDMSVTILGNFVGKLAIARFTKPQALNYSPSDHNYQTTEEPLSPIDENGVLIANVQQGAYEKANMSSSTMLLSFMDIHRRFQAVEDLIKKTHQLETESIGSWLKAVA